ncbi:Crp/Fnr family transcriptional regulator [Pseudoduganella sp. DS3]|uniref:Crp/Fnr family transcriptional regulator n=1 Tax=Pseudoduganella guangdongensis TaxID=2692179 RepID=A0A6N9HMH5_9BURK|nr:Crp/Fnr family transcriptional regulator [Pseudoduganella guangdongensis]MYN04764.1 Crp/Fnr family transcriptional regulator [Pseudoduganella guangdongensis]
MNQHFLKLRQHYKADMMARYGVDEQLFDETSQCIAPLAVPFAARRGELLQRVGQTTREVFWLTGGVARVGYVSEGGNEVTMRFATESNIANAYEDLLEVRGEQPSRSFIVAETSVQGFRFDWEQMSVLRRQHPVLMAYMTRMLEFAVSSQARRFVTHTASSADERLLNFRTEYPNLERRISQKVLASYLQITPAYLSQLMRREQEAA